ncbi:MAG TPA: hypothetical protein VFV03_03075 [Solirubrobacteraceae bacterium]|nr:hypothetical protein [Solirubrobacteraceae bacterium]
MANHLTPTELAREAGLGRREVLSKCLENGVPIFKGRIDKSLFMASVRQGPQKQRTAHAKT